MAITTLDNMKDALRNLNKDYYGNKTFASLYGANYLSGKAQTSSIAQSYNEAMEQAYTSSLAQRSAVQESNIGQGAKQEMMSDLDIALNDVYSQYMSRQATDVAKVNQAVAEGASAIDTALTEQATNALGVKEAIESYYTWLYENQFNLPDSNQFISDPLLSSYLTEVEEKDMAIDGKYIEYDGKYYRQKTLEELQREENWFDTEGNLGSKAQDFYDKMLNYGSTYENVPSFKTYLKEKNPKLYDWANANNQLGWAPNSYIAQSNKNIGIVREALGLKSTDETYSFIERKGGFSKEELNKIYKPLNDFESKADELYKKYRDDPEKLVKEFSPMITELQNLAYTLGLDRDVHWEELNNQIEKLKSGKKEVWGTFLAQTGTGFGAGITLGVTGGPVGIVAGVIVGLTSLVQAAFTVGDSTEQNQQISKAVRDAYVTTIASMIEASQNED